MSYCRVCGDEGHGTRYRAIARQTLCDACAKDTPAKVSRQAFDDAYWLGQDVGESSKREFYSDYLASKYTLAQYIKATVSEVTT